MGLGIDQTLKAWTELWNGDLTIAWTLCAPDFTIFFGRSEDDGTNPADRLTGPADFADFVAAFRKEHPGIIFSDVRHFGFDEHAASLWNVDWANFHRGGLDLFEFAESGLVERVWSITAQRPVIR